MENFGLLNQTVSAIKPERSNGVSLWYRREGNFTRIFQFRILNAFATSILRDGTNKRGNIDASNTLIPVMVEHAITI